MSWRGMLRKGGMETDGNNVDLFRGHLRIYGESVVIGAETVTVLLRDASDKVLLATGLVKPTDATNGYAKGCLFIKTDAGTGVKGVYENEGTSTACVFNVSGSITPSEIVIADGKIVIGGATGVGAAQTPGGDVAMTNAGVFSLIDRFRKRALTSINTVGAGTYLAAHMVGGIIQRDPNGAARADTLDTAANIVAAMENAVIGGFLSFFVHNIGSTGENITITSPGAPVTLDGSLDVIIRPGQVAHLLVRATNVTGAAEAVTVYRLDVPDIIAEHVDLADGSVLVGNASGLAQARTISGDAAITNAGVASLIDRYRVRDMATISTAGPETYLVASLLKGLIQRDPNGAARTDTLDTAANIVSGMANAGVGTFIICAVHNTGVIGEDITIASPGAPVTLDPSMDLIIVAGQVATLMIVATNIGGGTEAVTVFRLDAGDVSTHHLSLTDGYLAVGGATNMARRQQVAGDLSMTNAAVFSLIDRYRLRVVAAINTAGAGAPTVADTLGGMIKRNPSGAGAVTDTLPTAADIVAAIANSAIGTFYECVYRNESAIHAETVTLAAGAGMTLDPASIVIQPGNAKRLLFVATNVTLAAEAVTVYDITKPQALSGIVTAEDAHTTSRETNVDGLSSAITLCTEVRADMISHFANATRHVTGQQSSAAFGAVPTNLASLLVTAGTLLTAFEAHNADAILAAGWAYHNAQAADKALTSAVTPVTLQEAVTRLNDLKAKYNDHEDEAVGHDGTASVVADQVAAANAAYGVAILVPSANVLVGDLVAWAILNDGTGNVTGVTAVASAGGITFTFSADPQNDAIISYIVSRSLS